MIGVRFSFLQAFKKGVTYWDTADSYGRGENEKAIGKYFAKFPDDRKKVFLVTKAAIAPANKAVVPVPSSKAASNFCCRAAPYYF